MGPSTAATMMTGDFRREASAVDSVVLDGDVSRERLLQLLAYGSESSDLDYKTACDLTSKETQVELAKDVGAMMMAGGYIVFGADSQGRPTGEFTESQAKSLDEARLRPRLAKYIDAPIDLRFSSWDVDSRTLGVLFVAPAVRGYAVFKCDGQYEKGGKTKVVFRAGDIFHRAGTSSERLDAAGLEQLFQRQRVAIRADEQAAFAEHLALVTQKLAVASGGQSIVRAPSTALSYELSSDVFDNVVLELMRSDDDVPLRFLLRSTRRLAGESLTADSWEESAAAILDRVTSVAGLSLFVDKPPWFAEALRALVSLYAMAGDNRSTEKSVTLWLRTIEHVVALGGLAVRLEAWSPVRLLVLQRTSCMEPYYTTWLRHGLTMAARAGKLQEQEDERRVQLRLIGLARSVAQRVEALHPDVASEAEELLSSLTQFDMLACLIALSHQRHPPGGDFYPNFAFYDSQRTEPVVERLLDDGEGSMRQAVFPSDDAQLAEALRVVNETAGREGFWGGWTGFGSQQVREFLEKNPRAESQ